MKFIVSWWDAKEGLGIAVSESGVECLLHRSNISSQQAKLLRPRMVIHGEPKSLSGGITIIEKLRTSKTFKSPAAFRRTSSEVPAV